MKVILKYQNETVLKIDSLLMLEFQNIFTLLKVKLFEILISINSRTISN